MKWIKKGLIFKSDNNYEWMVSHASIPVVDKVNNEILRIYFSTRDKKGRSHPAYIDVQAKNPKNIMYIHNKPIFSLGKLGTFDDNGIMPSWLIDHNDKKYLYYIGWNPQITVSYRLSIGLAISEDGGKTFKRFTDGPICDRDIDEPYFNTAPCVLVEEDKWKMWYVSCTGWKIVNKWPEPLYHVKYAESNDGIHWKRTGKICIDYDKFAKAIGRPCVCKEDNIYKMFYSYRGLGKYRIDPHTSYRLGYAESKDGVKWKRKDEEVGIETSERGWDSEMIEYCYLFKFDKMKYLFYNGNGFGKSGIGYAVLGV